MRNNLIHEFNFEVGLRRPAQGSGGTTARAVRPGDCGGFWGELGINLTCSILVPHRSWLLGGV